MKRVLRYLRRALVGLALLIALAAVAVILFTRTTSFNRIARDELIDYLRTSYRGEVKLARIEGSIWGNLILYDLAVQYQGTEVLIFPRLEVSYRLLPLLLRRAHVRLRAIDPVAHLKQDSEGRWNLLEAFSSREPPSPKKSEFAVYLDAITIGNGLIELTPRSASPKTYKLSQTNVDGRIRLPAEGVRVDVRSFASRLTAPGLPSLEAEASLTYQDVAAPANLRVTKLKLATQDSRIALSGQLRDFHTMDVEATLLIEKLASVDLARFIPHVPLRQDLSGKLVASGPQVDLRAKLALKAADAEVDADIRADLSKPAPHYSGTVKIARLDIQKLLGEPRFSGIVDATANASGIGATFATISGETKLQARDVRVLGWQLGNVSISAGLAQKTTQFAGEVAAAYGRATSTGSVELVENPRYRVALSLEHFNPQKVVPSKRIWSADLNLKGAVQGTGFDLTKMDATAELTWLRSTVGPIAITEGRISARLLNGRVLIPEARMVAEGAAASVNGEGGLEAQSPGHLSYNVRAADLAPWFALVDRKGEGRLELSGEANGSLTDFQAHGRLNLAALRVDGYAIDSGNASYDISHIGQAEPRGSIDATLDGLRAGVALRHLQTTASFAGMKPLTVKVALKAQDESRHNHSLKAEGFYESKRVTGHLSEFTLELADGTWQIAHPVDFTEDERGATIERFRLQRDQSAILLDGNLSWAGEQNLLLQVERFDLASLKALMPKQPQLRGLISAKIEVRGTPGAPLIIGSADLTKPGIGAQSYDGLSATVNYGERRLVLNLVFRQDMNHSLTAVGSLPIALGWANGFEARVAGDVDLRIYSSGLSLAFLNSFTGKTVQRADGYLAIDVRAQGPFSRPIVSGEIRIYDGQARVVPLGVQISDIRMEARLEPEAVRIVQLSAKAGEGTLNGSGTIELRNFSPGPMNLRLSVNNWPASDTQQYKVNVGGDVIAEGTLGAAQVHGHLEVLNALLRPDLGFLSETSLQPDETIVVLRPGERHLQLEGAAPAAKQAGGFNNLAVDLAVVVHRNTSIRHQNGSAELTGKLHLVKKAGAQLSLVGVLETVRGWVAYQGRRFDLASGTITFNGGYPIDPLLDIDAQYRLTDYRVEVIVKGTARKPLVTLASEPELEQADILSLILFGKTASALRKGERADLQQHAVKMATGYAASQIGQAVSQTLGLEGLGIEMEDISLTGGGVGFGRYLTENTYVSASEDITGTQGHKVSVEYFLTSWLSITSSTAGDGSREIYVRLKKNY